MILWRWCEEEARWAPTPLRPGADIDLAPGARLLGLAPGRGGLLSAGPTRVNGVTALPFRVLDHRDELGLGGHPMYFSTEGFAELQAFSGERRETACARCTRELGPGEPSVRCPRCSAWYHTADALGCWTYTDTCAVPAAKKVARFIEAFDGQLARQRGGSPPSNSMRLATAHTRDTTKNLIAVSRG